MFVQAGGGGAAAPKKRSKLEELMEREQAFKKAKIEREKAGAGAGPSGRPTRPGCSPASPSRFVPCSFPLEHRSNSLQLPRDLEYFCCFRSGVPEVMMHTAVS